MIIPRSNYLTVLVACFSFGILFISTISSANAQQQAEVDMIQGKVSEIINVNSYTYAEVDTGATKIWVAGPKTELKVGEKVSFSTGMPMKGFYSESMKREFSLIYFINQFITDNHKAISSPKPPAHAEIKQLRQSFKGIDRVEGGQIIAEIHAEKDKLDGKTIRVRGQVTRYAAEIMGKNWLHIQDSSSFDDLTVTTEDTVAVGDVVIIEGKLELDKDQNT